MEIFVPKSHNLEPTVPLPKDPRTRLRGLDIFHGDEAKDWGLVHASFDFIFIKATQGTGNTDAKFGANWLAAKAHGIPRGPYHFMEWGEGTGAKQAAHFCDVVNKEGGLGELPPVCDWEHAQGSPSAKDLPVAKAFLDEVERKLGRKPIIYLSSSTPSEVGAPSWLANYPLWIASYRDTPKVPLPWKTWTFWQYTDQGPMPGFKNKGDLDYFNGSTKELLAL